jgi:hypothetical protein
MRFDDMIATVLAQPADRPDRIAAQWRQLVDLLAQHRAAPADAERAFGLLRRHRGEVDPVIRREAACALAGLSVDPELIAFFAEDTPAVAAPLIAGARLAGREWLDLLARLGPPARALLRHRRDLPADVKQALAVFGASDFALEGEVAPAPAAAAPADLGESQIRELVERIEAFRRQREEAADAAPPAAPSAPASSEAEPAQGFRWETGADGIVRWVEGAPREALVGQTLAAIAGPGQYGVDGQAAGAFEKRAPFRDARLSVAGEGRVSGDWRISGVPFFDPVRGSFTGYRGTARRPRLDEIARNGAASSGVFGPQFPADSLRQLIHEGQYMGPAARGYRGQAADIMAQARRLLSAVDDLDTAARIETRRLDLEESAVDAVALLGRLHESYQHLAGQRGSRLTLEVAPGLPLARVEPGAAERMFARLLAATIGLAGEGETIAARMALEQRGERTALRLSVDRPRSIAGLGEAALLDPGYSPEGDWPGAPALGLGFALRLVRNLADAAGGGLRIGEKTIALDLPVFAETEAEAGPSESNG